MKNGTSASSPSSLDSTLNDVKETISQFMDKIAIAKGNGDEWVETTPEIIHHYNRRGLGGAKYFLYDGIKVCEFGQSEKIEAEMHEPMGQRIFGKSEGVLEGR